MMTHFVSVFHVLFIFYMAFRIWKTETFLPKLFWPCLLIKLLAGISLGFLYTWYFPVGDTFSYFKDASVLASLAREDFSSYLNILFFNTDISTLPIIFFEPRAVFLSKITSVFNIATLDNYWVVSLYFSFISFLASWNLVKMINHKIDGVTVPSVMAFLLMPSIVFWSSGLIKETLAAAALYYLTAIFLKIWFREKLSIATVILSLFSLWIFWHLKYYFTAIFLPVVVTTLLYRIITRKGIARSASSEAIIWLAIFLLPIFLVSFVHPNFSPGRLLEVIVSNNAVFNQLSDPEDLVHFNDLQVTVRSILRNAPWAFFSGFFRPLLFEAGNVLQFLAGVENTLVLFFFFAACVQAKQYLTSPHRLLALAIIIYVTLLCILITLSAPNFGTLSRYRTGYAPFFVFLVLCNNPLLIYLQRSFYRLVSH